MFESMFDRKKGSESERMEVLPTKVEDKREENEASTILSSDTRFKGSLSFEKGLQIEGNFEGDITTAGTLHIGRDAKVKAEIKAGSVFVDGTVTGNIIASEKIELRSTAKLTGDIKAAKLVVEQGAMLAGRCEVSLKPSEKEKEVAPIPVPRSFDYLSKTPVEVSHAAPK